MRRVMEAAYAKVNLTLTVTGRRADGYHTIESLFQSVSLCDKLTLEQRECGFWLNETAGIPAEENIITRADRLLRREFPNLGGVAVTLEKNIPTQAGLGGGSTDAAAYLRGMDRLYGLGLGREGLRALAAELGTGVDALLGAQAESPAAPAVTLDALRDLLAARDAEEKRRRRLWGCAGGAAVVILTGLLAAVAWQYERQIAALNQNYAAIQSSYAAQQAELSAQISELQDAVRMGEATVLDWRWLPTDKLHRDADKSWMPVQVQVTPRTVQDGMTARLAVRSGDDTQLYDMTAAPDGSFAAQGIFFTVDSTYDLSVQWTADGTTTSEGLGTVDFNDEMTEPQIIWDAVGSSLDFGYYVNRVNGKRYLTLTCYPVELQVDAPPWMQIAKVEIDLRLNGDAGEPTATAAMDCEGEYSYGNSSRTESVWNGTFYSEDVENGWEYDGDAAPKYVVRVTDSNGGVWTEEWPLVEK